MIPERALSIRNPWAALIMSGNKLVENRTWSTPVRGTIIVHAGAKSAGPEADVLAEEFGLKPPYPAGYLGRVDLVDVHPEAGARCCGIWAQSSEDTGQPVFHWRLDNPRPFTTPIPGPGRLQLYPCPRDIAAAIARQDLVTLDDMLDTGLTFRQIDYWARRGYLRPDQSSQGTGYPRRWPAVERSIAQLMARLIEGGISVDVAASTARRAIEQGLDEVTLADGITLTVREVV